MPLLYPPLSKTVEFVLDVVDDDDEDLDSAGAEELLCEDVK